MGFGCAKSNWQSHYEKKIPLFLDRGEYRDPLAAVAVALRAAAAVVVVVTSAEMGTTVATAGE